MLSVVNKVWIMPNACYHPKTSLPGLHVKCACSVRCSQRRDNNDATRASPSRPIHCKHQGARGKMCPRIMPCVWLSTQFNIRVLLTTPLTVCLYAHPSGSQSLQDRFSAAGGYPCRRVSHRHMRGAIVHTEGTVQSPNSNRHTPPVQSFPSVFTSPHMRYATNMYTIRIASLRCSFSRAAPWLGHAWPVLVRLLDDPASEVRAAAAGLLGRLGTSILISWTSDLGGAAGFSNRHALPSSALLDAVAVIATAPPVPAAPESGPPGLSRGGGGGGGRGAQVAAAQAHAQRLSQQIEAKASPSSPCCKRPAHLGPSKAWHGHGTAC